MSIEKNVFESRGRAIKQEQDFPSVRKRTFLGRRSVTWSRRREELLITQMEQMWKQNKKKCSRVELRQWMCRISDIKKKTAAKDVTIWISHKLERGMFLSLWVTWSLGIIVWSLRLDRSLTYEVFRFLGDGGDLVVKSPFECAKQLLRRKAEVSALTLQPQVLLSKASPRCHSLAGGRREVKWESSCSNDNNNNNIIRQGCGSRAH